NSAENYFQIRDFALPDKSNSSFNLLDNGNRVTIGLTLSQIQKFNNPLFYYSICSLSFNNSRTENIFDPKNHFFISQ
ncbi:MAG: hypothetical protein KZQ83_08560, partial [gamma proteobacterium symbiont of Taylorina sp.]|nr:hypothetical protein [gamma proteobacterium symbiont of Taylorina sp.]